MIHLFLLLISKSCDPSYTGLIFPSLLSLTLKMEGLIALDFHQCADGSLAYLKRLVIEGSGQLHTIAPPPTGFPSLEHLSVSHFMNIPLSQVGTMPCKTLGQSYFCLPCGRRSIYRSPILFNRNRSTPSWGFRQTFAASLFPFGP